MTDPLSEVLSRLCLPRWRAGMVMIARDSAVDVPAGSGSFYAVVRGNIHLQVSTNATELVSVEGGDFGLLSHGTSHRLIDGVGSTTVTFDELLEGESGRGSFEPNETSVVYGFFPLAAFGRNPFAGVLPEIVLISERSTPLLTNAKPLIELIAEEQRTQFTGWEATVIRLVQVLFLQTLRAHVANQPGVPRQANWLSAAMDPTIGPVLKRIHSEPEQPWTVNSLAKQTNMAKSAFSERFRQVVGEPPLQYLTGYRMQKACELLCESGLGVKEIAALVGYESASSFSNAFKRLIGKSPAEFRSNGDA